MNTGAPRRRGASVAVTVTPPVARVSSVTRQIILHNDRHVAADLARQPRGRSPSVPVLTDTTKRFRALQCVYGTTAAACAKMPAETR